MPAFILEGFYLILYSLNPTGHGRAGAGAAESGRDLAASYNKTCKIKSGGQKTFPMPGFRFFCSNCYSIFVNWYIHCQNRFFEWTNKMWTWMASQTNRKPRYSSGPNITSSLKISILEGLTCTSSLQIFVVYPGPIWQNFMRLLHKCWIPFLYWGFGRSPGSTKHW